MGFFGRNFLISFATSLLAFSGTAFAAEGKASPWEIGLQDAATPIMQQITSFHNFVFSIILLICLFVMGLLAYVMVRFNEKRNPEPSRTSHNTLIEVIWTVVPILILVMIAIPSFRLLFAQYDFPKADLTVNVTGHQWYWSYEYPDENVSFDSFMVQDSQLKPDQPRLLTVDNELVVPVNANVLVQVKSTDVIHDWAMPSFGIKLDAVPGRLQTTWFRALKTGRFHGQCSELCGVNHAFMPITVHVVSEDQYKQWLADTKQAFLEGKTKVAQVRSEKEIEQLAAAKSGSAPDRAKLAAAE